MDLKVHGFHVISNDQIDNLLLFFNRPNFTNRNLNKEDKISNYNQIKKQHNTGVGHTRTMQE